MKLISYQKIVLINNLPEFGVKPLNRAVEDKYMPLVPWRPFFEPFEDLEKFFGEDVSSMVPAKIKGFMPTIDVYEKDDKIVVEAPLAGVDAKDVEVSIENDVLTIRGKSEHKSEVDEKNYYRKEVRYGNFYRTVALPAHVDADKAMAVSESGMLKITLPKLGVSAKSKKISVSKKAVSKKVIKKKTAKKKK